MILHNTGKNYNIKKGGKETRIKIKKNQRNKPKNKKTKKQKNASILNAKRIDK